MEVGKTEMKEIEASMIICHHNGDCRVLKEVKGTGSRYLPSTRESKLRVNATIATQEDIKKELAEIGITPVDESSLLELSKKHSTELVSRRGGRLVYSSDSGHYGLYKITEFLEDEVTLKRHGFI